jgi:hypothetical protein
MAISDYNPFAKQESMSNQRLLWFKVLTILSWLLVVVMLFIYHSHHPTEAASSHSIWWQNEHHHSPFGLNKLITDIYWLALLILQGVYIWHLYSGNESWRTHAGNVGSHFILNNLFWFGFIMCFVRGHFWPAEIILIANFINLTWLYFRNSTTPRLIHIPVVSGPLAFNFVALFWNGAIMVGAHHLAARIVANVFIWSILGYGFLYLVVFKDYTMGFELAILSLSLAIAQMATKIFALQWIFAFVIAGVLALLSLLVGVPGIFGKELTFRREGQVVSSDRERQPLLDDE